MLDDVKVYIGTSGELDIYSMISKLLQGWKLEAQTYPGLRDGCCGCFGCDV